MPIKLPNGKFRVQIRVKGHPRIDQVFDTKKAATAFEREERERLDKNAPLHTLEMTFREAWKAYRGSLLFQAKRPSTRRTEESRIERALAALGDYSLAQLVDGQVIARFRDELGSERVQVLVRRRSPAEAARPKPQGGRGKKVVRPLVPGHRRDGRPDGTLSNDAQRLVLAAVSSVMLWAVEQRIMVYNPVRGLKKPKPRQRDRRMERDEELNIFTLAESALEADRPVNRAARFVALQRELGCRPGELSALRNDDIDLCTQAVRFRDTKNGSTRIVHMVRKASNLIGIQQAQHVVQDGDSPYLFTSRSRVDGRPVPFSYTAAIKLLRRRKIVDTDFHAHAARREFASGAFEVGLPIEDIRKQTGHKSVKALEVYNKSDGLHPETRQRIDAAARARDEERFNDMAAALGVAPEELRKLQLAKSLRALTLVGHPSRKSKVASPLRKPVTPVPAKRSGSRSD
jgi:integrase